MANTRKQIVVVTLLAGALLGCETASTTTTMRDRANTAVWQGRWSEAEQLYGNLVAQSPEDWRLQYGYGLSAMHTGGMSDARQALEIAHTLKPSNRQIALDLAETMYQQKDYNSLFRFLSDRAEARKDSSDWLLLGEYALMTNDPDSAREYVAQAMVVDDASSVDPYLRAAIMSEQMGDLDAAKRYLRTGWEVDPTNETIQERLRSYGIIPGPTLAMPSSDTR